MEEEDDMILRGGEGTDPFAGDGVGGVTVREGGDSGVGVGDVGAFGGGGVDLVVDGALDVDVVVGGEVAGEGEEEGG